MKHLESDDIDEQVDRALHALRDAKPADGLERRTLAAMEALTGSRTARSRRSRLFSSFGMWPQAITGALATGLILAAVLLHSRENQPRPRTMPHRSPETEQAAAATPMPSASQPRSTHVVTPAMKLLVSETPGTPSSVVTDPQEALALAETLAPSKPSPTAALTRQERLLIRAMRSNNFTQLADLETTRETAWEAAVHARERQAEERYITRMLAPLVAAEALHPTEPTAPGANVPARPDGASLTSSEPQP